MTEVFIPALVAMLVRAEKLAERPLTKDEVLRIRDDATVVVRLLGSCKDCSMSQMTLKAGLEEAVKRAAPEVKAVVAENLTQFV